MAERIILRANNRLIIISPQNRCFIIAEAGVNHNGSVSLAKKLIDSASKAGADAIKFQTFKTEEIVTRDAGMAEYQKKNLPSSSQYEMLKKLELSEDDFRCLFDYATRKKILFLSTPFDQQSAAFLHDLGVPAFKISSGEITNIPLLTQIARYHKPIILSTGMSTLNEVKIAVRTIQSTGNKKLILLHCTSNYPTDHKDVNLKSMETLARTFKLPVGYSDHTVGNIAAIAAVALGAVVVEKHFTLDKNLKGPDHKASADPGEFKDLVKSIRTVEKLLGSGIKRPTPSEKNIMRLARKSIVSARHIPKNTTIASQMLAFKRPGYGIPPSEIATIIGKKSTIDIPPDKLIKRWMLK